MNNTRFVCSGRNGRPTVSLASLPAVLLVASLAIFTISVDRPQGRSYAKAPNEAPVARPGEDAAQGCLIRVPLPILGNVDQSVKGMVQRAISRFEKGTTRPVIVLEFAPGKSEFGQGTQFSRAFDLAQYLSSKELAGVKTVAYIPRTIKGHAVLVAMACEEIVMSPDAELGEAGIDQPEDEPILQTVLSGYRQIAKRRQTIPENVSLGMLDKNIEVLKVKTLTSVEFVLRSELDDLKKNTQVLSEEVLIRPGELGRFTGREGRELGFVKYLPDSREDVAKALGLPAKALEEDPSLGGNWTPVLIAIEGEIRPQMISRVESMIDDQLRSGEVNFLCLRITSTGGSLELSNRLATYLAQQDRSTVRIVAYVPKEARGDAALIATACHDVIMRPEAVLGGAGVHEFTQEQIAAETETIRKLLAPAKSRSWSLTAALIDPELRVFRYKNSKTGAVDYFCEAELKDQDDPDQWEKGAAVTNLAGPFELTGAQAKDLNLADFTVENFDEFKQVYGLSADPRLVEPNWADFLIQALARDEVAGGLLVIGFVALIIELHLPGIGIAGFVAAVSFLLFFWAKHLDATAGWLEVLLFLAGFVCLLLEIFVIPGFGVFGLGGGLLIISSLVLASQTFVLPSTPAEYEDLQRSLTVVGVAAVVSIAAVYFLRRYLPRAPVLNRLMLQPPAGEEAQQLATRESMTHFEHLLGQEGVTTTLLTPSGKARFGDELIDVTSESDVIDRGTMVRVVGVRGSRVVVKVAS